LKGYKLYFTRLMKNERVYMNSCLQFKQAVKQRKIVQEINKIVEELVLDFEF
jgi:hypothetical protein